VNDRNFQSEYGQVALYIHIPFCTEKCCYCSFFSEPITNHDARQLVAALICEMDRYINQSVNTVYIGGGTPSCLPTEYLLDLINAVKSRWPQSDEFTLEVNPGQIDANALVRLYNAGIDRLSIGAQSFNEDELEFLSRRHTVAAIKQTVQVAKQIGYDNINLDLIFAIPGSTVESWANSLNTAIDLEVHHISAYSLTYEQGTLLDKLLAMGQVEPIDEETDCFMYEMAINLLENAGYMQYEISNFAKPEFECRHNLTYWANRPYIGIGPAASSYLDGQRMANIENIEKYVDAMNTNADVVVDIEKPNEIETACETAVLNLRRIRGIDFAEFEEQTGYDAIELFAEPIDRFQKQKLLEISNGRVYLTGKALPIADSILCEFAIV